MYVYCCCSTAQHHTLYSTATATSKPVAINLPSAAYVLSPVAIIGNIPLELSDLPALTGIYLYNNCFESTYY